MNKIKVDVMGYTGTGKSTIIQVIEEALFAAGLKSVVNLRYERPPIISRASCQER